MIDPIDVRSSASPSRDSREAAHTALSRPRPETPQTQLTKFRLQELDSDSLKGGVLVKLDFFSDQQYSRVRQRLRVECAGRGLVRSRVLQVRLLGVHAIFASLATASTGWPFPAALDFPLTGRR